MKGKIFIMICFLFAACQSQENKQLKPIADVLLKPKATRLEQSTQIIDSKTELPEIRLETAKINVVAEELKADDITVNQYKQQIADLQAQVNKIKSEQEKAFQRIMAMGQYIGGGMVIVGIVLAVLSFRIPALGGIGLLLLAAGACLSSVCYAIATNSYVLVWCGIPIIIGSIGFGVFAIVHRLRKDTDYKTALTDLVKTVEIAKTHLPNWDDVVCPLVSKLQSPKTQQLIRIIKNTEVNTKA